MFLILKVPPTFDTKLCSDLNQVFVKQLSSGQEIRIYRAVKQKPVDDSFFLHNEKHACLLEGVIVNAGLYLNQTAAKDLPVLVTQSMLNPESGILAKLHGQFCGLIYDNDTSAIRIFTNQINSLRIYYYNSGQVFIAGTSLRQINLLLSSNGISATVDETASRMLLTYGFILSGKSTLNEIKQIQAGRYLELNDNNLSIILYHEFNNETKHRDLAKIIPTMQELFVNSVRYSFEKDVQAGVKHSAFLSGGLDSRQTVMTAYNLGFKDITCYNFCEPGYADEIIARKIAKALNLNLVFYPLEGGRYFLELEKNLIYNYGQITLNGAGHLYAAINSFDLSGTGILHTGQLGDGLLGTLLKSPEQTAPVLKAGYYSNKLFDTYINDIASIKDEYANHEMFLLYGKCFNGVMNGDYACAELSYSVSPFMEPEFAQYCLNIDPKLRYKHHCYKEWIRKTNHLGASFQWEKYGSSLLVPDWYSRWRYLSGRAVHKLYNKFTNTPDRRSMNPFDYWWRQNPDLALHFKNTPEHLENIKQKLSPELYNDTSNLFKSSQVNDKILAYTLIAGLEYLFDIQ